VIARCFAVLTLVLLLPLFVAAGPANRADRRTAGRAWPYDPPIVIDGYSLRLPPVRGGASTPQWWIERCTAPSTSVLNHFAPLSGVDLSGHNTSSTTYATVSVPMAGAGTILQLRINFDTAPGGLSSWLIQIYKNGSASTATNVTISGTTTTSASTFSLAVAVGDTFTIATTPSGGPASSALQVAIEYLPTTADNFIYGGYPGGTNSQPTYKALFQPRDDNNPSGTHVLGTNTDIAPIAGTIAALAVAVQTAPGGVATRTYCVDQNGSAVSATNVVLTGAATAGSVTGLSVAVSQFDLMAFSQNSATGSPVNPDAIKFSVVFVPTPAGQWFLPGLSGSARSNNSTNYTNYSNVNGWQSTEAAVPISIPGSDIAVVGIAVRQTTGPGGGASWAFTDRINSGNGTATVSFTGSTVQGSDFAHTDNLNQFDIVDLASVPASTPTSCGANAWGIVFAPQTAAGGSVWTDFGIIQREHNPTDNGPTVTYYFEAVLKTSDAGFAAHARLYNVTTAAAISGSDISTTNTTPTRVRSAAITLTSGSNVYKAQKGGPVGATFYAYAADIIADVSA
jgi:hypothetical protein